MTLPASFLGKTVDYNEANLLGAVISPDGLTLYGLSSPDASDGITSSGKRNLKLQISISGTVSATLSLDREFSLFTSINSEVPLSTVDIGAISAMGCGFGGIIGPQTARITRTTQAYSWKQITNYEGIVGFIDAIDGQLERFNVYSEFVDFGNAASEHGSVPYSAVCGGPSLTKVHFQTRVEHPISRLYRIGVGTGQVEKMCIGSGVLSGENNFDVTNRCGQISALNFGDYQAVQDYDGPDATRPPIVYQPINPRSPAGNIDIIDYKTNGVLSPYVFNNKPQDAMLLRIGPTGIRKPLFRDYTAKDFLYVMEASPFGDIFFAERDLSKVIHEPGRSGIQPIAIPANIRSIEAAIWL